LLRWSAKSNAQRGSKFTKGFVKLSLTLFLL